jgi:hypothetical protein
MKRAASASQKGLGLASIRTWGVVKEQAGAARLGRYGPSSSR